MASLYWVGGANTWNSTAGAKWATSSGGASGAAAPTAADDVFIDANSTGTITLSTTTVARSINFTGFTGTVTHPTTTTVTIGDGTAGASNIALKLVAGMTYTLGNTISAALSFVSTSATQQSIDFAGKSTGSVTFNGAAGSWQFASDHTQGSANSVFTMTNGTLDLNGKTCSWGAFALGSGTKTLTCGAAQITCNGANGWGAGTNTTNFTMNAGTSAITLVASGANFDGGGLTYNNVVFTPAGATAHSITGANTFANLTYTGGAAKTYQLNVSANQTVTGTFTVNGNSAINRVLLTSDTYGTARTITAAVVSMSNVDLQDITGAGAASWNLSAITGLSGDCGGNSGITFTTASTQTATGTASFSWSTHGWTTHVPLPQDTVSVPNAFIAGRVVTVDMPRLGKDISFTCTGNPSYTSTTTSTVYGSFTLASGMTTATGNALTFAGRGTHNITTNGVSIVQPMTFGGSGSYLLQDALTTTVALTLTNGGLNTNGNNVTSLTFVTSGALSRNLTMGMNGSTWNLTSTAAATVWNVSGSNYTIVSYVEGIIQIANASANARTFAGGAGTYGTLTYIVAGSTGSLTITGSNTFNGISFSDSSNARSLLFTAGTTQTIKNFYVAGTPGKLMTVDSVTAATHTLSKASATVSADYLSVKNSIATGGATWYAGANSTNVSGNTGWTFSAAPTNITRGQVAGSGHGITGGFGAQSVTLPGAVTVGQLLVCLWVGNSNVGPATCADNINGAWTALTEQTPVVGSGRRMNWFYKLNSAGAAAGALTVTVTPNANTGNSEWMQVATYNGITGYDSSVNAYSTWSGGAGTISQLSGTPSQSGDLILYGIMSDNENTQTMTTVSPMTSMVLDGSNKSGGTVAPFAIAFDEFLGAPASAVTAAMSLSAGGDDGGRWVIGFTPLNGSVVTKTQSAIARIALNQTKTQAAIARIAAIRTKLQTATANILASSFSTKTQSALARLSIIATKTQPATSRLLVIVTKTQAAVTRIAINQVKTQPALSRIAVIVTKTQPTVARIARTITKTQPATSRIAAIITKTQSSVAYIAVAGFSSKTQSAIARIARNSSKTQSLIAKIANTRSKTQTARASVAQTFTKTQSAIARIMGSRLTTQTAVARIFIGSVFTKVQTALARVSNRGQKFQTATSRIIQTTYLFTTPTTEGQPRGTDRFWRHFRPQLQGITVLKEGGVYRETLTPTSKEVAAADIAYLGGHEHIVSADEAIALANAGYTITTGVTDV